MFGLGAATRIYVATGTTDSTRTSKYPVDWGGCGRIGYFALLAA
jgi:hypothetical protein